MTETASAPGHVLVLAIESFGGSGGVAAYTRDLIGAYIADPRIGTVTAVSRLPQVHAVEPPAGLKMVFPKAHVGQYALAVLREMLRAKPALIHCTHINMAPLADAMSRLFRVPWWLTLHGAEAWQPHRNSLVNRSASRAGLYLPVSNLTLGRFRGAFPEAAQGAAELLSPSVDTDRFRPGPTSPDLRSRLGFGDRPFIVTIGRLSASERAKGFDRIIAVMPTLRREFADLAYVIAGSGDDAERLLEIAREMGVADSVVLTGYISEDEKVGLYRAASAYVMPSVLEGFGIVFLEAMACGTACVASTRDAGAEAVRDFGEAVDPFDPTALASAITRAIRSDKAVPGFITDYSTEAFRRRVSRIVDDHLSFGTGRK